MPDLIGHPLRESINLQTFPHHTKFPRRNRIFAPMKPRPWLSLTPIAVFLAVYLTSSLIAGDFYRIPVSAAFLIACIYAFCISGGSIAERIGHFSRGAGNPSILLMVWIFILAGVFATTAKEMGAIDATVQATVGIIPPRMLFAGLFLTACFISMAVGTSVGTIVALVPLGSGIAAQCGVGAGYMAAIIVGGAFFGDNLSFISDTTIAATRAAGCEMRDKFKTNIRIILPAVVVVTGIYLFQGQTAQLTTTREAVEWIKILPYLMIIILALAGVNVLVSLALGIGAVAVIGWAGGSFNWEQWLVAAGQGIGGMSDLILVTLLAGGMLEMIRQGGGLDWLTDHLSRGVKGPRGAQASIAALVSLANVCTANNTIAIITTGHIAKDIATRYGVSPQKTASILDTFSCLIQGLLPYGAQLLMASGLAACAPTEIIPHLYYPMCMGICAIVAILIGRPQSRRRTA